MVRLILKRMGRHVTRYVTGSEDEPKGMDKGVEDGAKHIYMYVCEGGCLAGHRLEDGEDGMRHRGQCGGPAPGLAGAGPAPYPPVY
ncbi:hypothetical protein HanPI659440_Chr07g0259361 [Helianthus annuus]|nr:hypothetical protein HanPI659440_Chr07g0259361 [Helianthus annuus]